MPSLFLAFSDFDVEADNAVLITEGDNGNAAGHVVFELNNLLQCHRYVCTVGHYNIEDDLLFNRHLRSANHIGRTGKSLWIDLDSTHPEQSLDAAGDR